MKDQFNPIHRSSCQLIGCRATPCTLEDMESIRVLVWNLIIMNDLGYDQMSNTNWSLKLILICGGIIGNSFNISTTLANDSIASHCLSQSNVRKNRITKISQGEVLGMIF